MSCKFQVVTFFNWSSPNQTVLEDQIYKINSVTKRTKLTELCRTRWIQRLDAFDAFVDFNDWAMIEAEGEVGYP